MRKICYFATEGRAGNILAFLSTTDITLLCAHWAEGFIGINAEVDTDRQEVCEYQLMLLYGGQDSPDYDVWRYWCTVAPHKHQYEPGGQVVTLPRAHLYVKREHADILPS